MYFGQTLTQRDHSAKDRSDGRLYALRQSCLQPKADNSRGLVDQKIVSGYIVNNLFGLAKAKVWREIIARYGKEKNAFSAVVNDQPKTVNTHHQKFFSLDKHARKDGSFRLANDVTTGHPPTIHWLLMLRTAKRPMQFYIPRRYPVISKS
ncbi:hypothetical protein [Leisingera sp. ANG59]|uniref:hypothetical protein n=1 Tax=Leisingera sp. ANG59 TaxID=2675221 RepID=UPI001573EAFB|nr:hypothetical protein [Leisingera sp. ANG59]NSY37526.1 hypothetical protein [Leisingera sp. ANG59]